MLIVPVILKYIRNVDVFGLLKIEKSGKYSAHIVSALFKN